MELHNWYFIIFHIRFYNHIWLHIEVTALCMQMIQMLIWQMYKTTKSYFVTRELLNNINMWLIIQESGFVQEQLVSGESTNSTHWATYCRRHIEIHFLKRKVFSSLTECCEGPVGKKSSSVQMTALRNVKSHLKKLIQYNSCKTNQNTGLACQIGFQVR